MSYFKTILSNGLTVISYPMQMCIRDRHTTDSHQIIIVDTPGVHKPHDTLGEELNTTALKSLEGIDVAAFVLDASAPFGTGDEWVISQLAQCSMPKLLVLSKIDLVTQEELELQRQRAVEAGQWDGVVALSSVTGEQIDVYKRQQLQFEANYRFWKIWGT